MLWTITKLTEDAMNLAYAYQLHIFLAVLLFLAGYALANREVKDDKKSGLGHAGGERKEHVDSDASKSRKVSWVIHPLNAYDQYRALYEKEPKPDSPDLPKKL